MPDTPTSIAIAAASAILLVSSMVHPFFDTQVSGSLRNGRANSSAAFDDSAMTVTKIDGYPVLQATEIRKTPATGTNLGEIASESCAAPSLTHLYFTNKNSLFVFPQAGRR